MTMIEQWTEISTNIHELYNRLYSLLEKYQADINSDMSFEDLCWAVENIPGKIYPQNIDKRPFKNIIYDPNGSIIHKDVYVYNKIRYFKEILSYALAYKGVALYKIKSKTKLSELIELINDIEGMHQSFLTITSYDDIFYYNTYTYVHYDLIDENNNLINEGHMIVKHNNTIIAEGYPQTVLKILPTLISESESFEIYYEGTDGYRESNHIIINVPIKPPKIRLNMSTVNKSLENRNDGITSNTIFFDTDDIEISVQAINVFSNTPMSNVPIVVRIPNKNGVYHTVCRNTTDENGYIKCHTNIEVHNSELEHIYIYAASNIDNEVVVSNDETNQEVYVKWSPLQTKDYKFYAEEENKTMEISYHNIDTGILTSEYSNNYTVKVFVEEDLYSVFTPPTNKTNSQIICNKTDVGLYTYTYVLYKNNKKYYETTSNVKINPLLHINLYIPDKLLITSHDTLECIVEVLDYHDNLVSLPNGVYLCTTYDWSCTNRSQIYSINNTPTTIQLPISHILNKCNGFFIQAISVDDIDTYSNIIYVRNYVNHALNNTISINSVQRDYTLGDSIIDIYGTFIDEENNPVIYPFSIQVKINNQTKETYNIVPQYNGKYNKTINIKEEWLGDDIQIICSFSGKSEYYAPFSDNITVMYTKADINYWNTTGNGTVYQYCNNTHTIGLSEHSIYNKYIDGKIIYQDNENDIDSNIFDTQILTDTAGVYKLTIQYSGNKYYNSKTHIVDININKTTDYNFNVNYNNEVTYPETITFTPILEDGNNSVLPHTYTGTIQYNFMSNETINTQIQPYIYTPINTGLQNVTIIYSGDINHESKIITKDFNVLKATPSINLTVPEYDAMFNANIDESNPILTTISYDGNDELVIIDIILDNNSIITETLESNDITLPIDTPGIHNIILATQANKFYNAITIKKEIEVYNFLDELYGILLDINNEENYEDKYLIADETYKILHCLTENNNNYNQNILERFYNILNALGE